MKQQARYETLDGLRGIAAIGVMLFHFSIIGLPIAKHGYLAVDLFFVLSGFVMSHAYSDRLTGMPFSTFVKLRLIRIMPLSTLGLLVGTSYFVIRYYMQPQSQYGLNDIISGSLFNVFLLPKPWTTPTPTDTMFTSNTPLWSLSLEVFLNFLWASILFNSRNTIILALIVISAIGVASSTLSVGTADIGATWPTYLGGIARATFGFFAGVALCRHRPEPNKSFLYPIISASALVLIIFSPDLGPVFDIIVILFVFPSLIYLASSADYRIERPIFGFLGSLSYPLYVIHVPILHFVVGFAKSLKIEDQAFFVGCAASLACILAAIALDRLYDRPVRTMLTGKLAS